MRSDTPSFLTTPHCAKQHRAVQSLVAPPPPDLPYCVVWSVKKRVQKRGTEKEGQEQTNREKDRSSSVSFRAPGRDPTLTTPSHRALPLAVPPLFFPFLHSFPATFMTCLAPLFNFALLFDCVNSSIEYSLP
jgi:hypothetical protein